MPSRMPNAAPPGSLATYRVGLHAFEPLRTNRRVQIVTNALGSRTGPGLPRRGDKQEVIPVASDAKAAYFLKRLASLLRDDRLYTAERQIVTGNPTVGDLEVRLQDSFTHPLLTVFLKEHRLWFFYTQQGVTRSIELLLDPVGRQLLDLVREVVPATSVAARLPYTPLPPPARIAPVDIPTQLLRRLQAVEAGMRRADVLRLLETEGGLSSRFEERFVHPHPLPSGKRAKVTVRFAPANTRIRWLDGVGYPVQAITSSAANKPENDIVIRVSTPYAAYSIAD